MLQQKVEKPSKILDQQVSGKVESSKKPDTFLNGTSVVKGISRAINRGNYVVFSDCNCLISSGERPVVCDIMSIEMLALSRFLATSILPF